MVYKDEVIPSPSASRLTQWFGFDQFQPERAVTSHLISSKTFLYIRAVQVLYSGAVQWASICWMAIHYSIGHYFAYFTYYTFIGLHFYFLTSFYHHVRYLLSSKRPTSFLYQSSILNHLYVYLYHTTITFNLVTPIVYWVLLSSDFVAKAGTNPPMEWWLTPSVHGVSMIMMLIDVILNRMIIQKRICFLVLLTVVFYICLAFIYYAIEHWWVYSFMDWTHPVGIHALRDRLTLGKQTMVVDEDEAIEKHDKAEFKPFESSIESQITFGGTSSTEHLTK
ncbi:hypothetical protein BC941DRAFT_464632 [Chlamydoabsidia padenii]|nr:hypothetical protein BC941DRAFT_464632 [Chlamydoabsidia padenii]